MKSSIRSGLIGLATAGALCISPTTHAGLVMNIAEVGADVVFSMNAGTLDTTGLSAQGRFACGPAALFGFNGAIGASTQTRCMGFSGQMTVTKSAGWSLGNLSSGVGMLSSATGTSGTAAVENFSGSDDIVYLAIGAAVPGIGLNSMDAMSGTVGHATFSAMGLTANQFIEYKWGSDSVLFTTGAMPNAAVPEPTSLALVALALAGLGCLGRRSSCRSMT